MKKNLKKLLSLLTALTILFTMAAIPAMAEGETSVTVDFTESGNVAYQKTVTPKAGRDYYSKSSTKPSASSQLATDGDITTWHQAATRTGISWGTSVGSEFSIDLGGSKNITSIDLYVQPTIHDGSMDRYNTSLKWNVYGGNDAATGTLIGEMTIPAEDTVVTAGGQTMNMRIYHIDFPADSVYGAVTFELTNAYYAGFNEIYVNGTDVSGGSTEPVEPDEPEVPTTPTETVDFAASTNIAYKKTVTAIAGAYYSSGYGPNATRQWATDGDINTFHSGYGRATTSSSSEKTGVVFSMDLGKEYNLEDITIYVSQTQRYCKVYRGTAVDENNLLLTTTCDNVSTTVNGREGLYKLTGTFPEGTKAQSLTFNYPEGTGFPYYEIYVKGTEAVTPAPDPDPEVPTSKTVDFTEAGNVAYQKTITPKAGRDKYVTANGLTAPSASSQLGTDGDITTYHLAAGRSGISWGTVVGTEFSVDLGGNKKITSVDLYAQPIMNDGSNDRENKALTINVYGGNDATTGTLIGEMTKPVDGATTSITAGGKTMDMCVYHIDFPADAEYSAITFESSTNWYFGYNEIYVAGTEGTPGGGTEPETPVIPTGTVDFTEAANIAYGKTLTHIQGHYYSSGLAPAETRQFATDGDIATFHSGYGKVSGQTVGVAFSIDLGKTYKLSQINLYLAETGQSNRSYKLYKGTAINETNLIAEVPASNTTATVNGKEVAVNSFAVSGDVEAQYLTFYYTGGYGFAYSELYITGTEVTGTTPEPEEPEIPGIPDGTIDFTAANNIAYGKTLTHINGHYYSSGLAPAATRQFATDGNMNTWHAGYGKVSGQTVGVSFYIDLGQEYELGEVALFVNPAGRGYKVYKGTVVDEANYLADGIPTGELKTVNDGATQVDKVTATFPAGTKARYLTFYYSGGYGFSYYEMYMTGTAVGGGTEPDYAALVAADKAALNLGDTSVVVSNLTLPLAGSVNNSTITWATSDASVITNTGVITRGAENKTATLTATITNGTATDTKTFTVTVAKKEITTVDFKAAKNLAYGKIITPKSGKDYYVGSSTKPSATSQLATDGDITTWHMAAGRKNISWGTTVGAEFNLDLGKSRVIKSVYLYAQEGIYDSINSVTGEFTGNYRTLGSMTINVYGGEDSTTGTLIGQMTKPTALETITADGKTMDMYIYRIDFPAGATYDKITFDSTNWYFGYNEIYVEYELTDEDYETIVASDKAALDLGNTSNVISDLTLPLVGADGSTITWATSDASVITETGTVTRAAENKTATLTATITNGTASDTKIFEITVLGTDSAEGRVASDKAALDLGDTSAVTENLTLPTVGDNGSTITWRTNNPSVIEVDGTVHRDIDSNRATLTATITYGDAFEAKQFSIVVLGTETDEDRVASDKETLTLGDTSAVKGNLTLPTVGAKGTTITWATSDASVITNTGVVTRGDADKTVTLTATIKYNNVTATKTFTVTVPKKVVVEGTVDFSAAENVAYNKVVTPVSGRDKYAQSSIAPDEENNYTTDGDITTFHMGATRSNVSWGTTVGSEFTIDLAETFTIESVDLFSQPEMYNGYSSTPNSNKSLAIYVFGDGNKDTGTFIGQMIVPAATTIISDGTNELEVCVYHIDFPVNSHYSTLSFYSASGYFWGWNEVYVKGESTLAANVTDDKKALEFGDLNDVVEDLELPLVGAKKGSTITWATTDASVIETDGTVHRAEHTKKAKLTATITKGDASDTKEFLVTVLGTYDNHYVINSDAFNETNDIKHKYVVKNTSGSTVAVNTENNKLEMTRNEAGELSAKKYFVTERSDMPYSVIGDKVVVEQLMAISDGLQGATAEIRNKNDEVVATYGIKKEGNDYVFFLNVGGREQSTLYTYGDEIFTRIELVTENGASKVVAFVGTEYGVNSVAEFPLQASVHPSMTTVKYSANEGGNGKLILDGVKFMVEGANKDEIAVVIENENFKDSYITTQNFDAITSNLSLKADSVFGCKYSYESSNPDVLSDEGFVTRPIEDTVVTLTAIIKKGESSMSKTFTLTVKGLAADNMAMGNLILSSGAIVGSNDKNAIDGLTDTAFITDAAEKFFAICFEKAIPFNQVILMEAKNESDEYGVTGFEIQVSDNGVTWKTVYTGTTVGESLMVEFPQETAQYIRYYVTSLEGTQTGLNEFIVLYDPVPEVAVELDLQKVTIVPNNYNVTGDLTLMTVGEYGSVITWKSSHPDIITDDGRLISTPEKTTTIRLTATVTNEEFTRTKEFTLSVQGSSTGNENSGNGNNEKPGGVSGGGSGAGGGGGNSSEKEDPKPVDPTPAVPSSNGFKDVESDRWSYAYIMELKEAGIVSGDGENFRPTDKVTREEFVKMLVLSLGITPEGTADFDDVASDAWYHDYIAVAVEKGIVNGLSDNEFGIGRSISRQDMAVMTVRALKALNVDIQSGEAPVFTDGDEIAGYAEEAVEILAAAGILAGSDGKFAPTDNLTREQAAKVLCMIRKELTK